jgi:hypothetical protein
MKFEAIYPMDMTVQQWTDSMAFSLSKYGLVRRLDNEKDWQDWAQYIVNLPKIAILSPPNPAEFTDWREWARRFLGAVS